MGQSYTFDKMCFADKLKKDKEDLQGYMVKNSIRLVFSFFILFMGFAC